MLEEILPDSGLRDVIRTGIPQVGVVWNVNGQDLVVSRLPVFDGKHIRGAMMIILFRRLYDALRFGNRIVGADTQLGYYKEQVKRLWGAKYSFDSIIGNSLVLMEAKRMAWDIAGTNSPVLITGETGTGKELFAHAIHQDSPRKDGPFVVINCAAIPDNLVESELFGYEPGAFTGATKEGKQGKFELAHNGSIFLDEVGELPVNVQAKLLRVLQEKEIEKIGSSSSKPINVRIISASNLDLEEMSRQGKFREDLFYRLNVFSVRVPPLRDRLEDIISLSDLFISEFNRDAGTGVRGIDEAARQVLMNYNWPGNVRELKSAIERACLDAKAGMIRKENLFFITCKASLLLSEESLPTLKEARYEAERNVIQRALELSGGNRVKACQMLDINRTSFYNKLKELDIK